MKNSIINCTARVTHVCDRLGVHKSAPRGESYTTNTAGQQYTFSDDIRAALADLISTGLTGGVCVCVSGSR